MGKYWLVSINCQSHWAGVWLATHSGCAFEGDFLMRVMFGSCQWEPHLINSNPKLYPETDCKGAPSFGHLR